jgi:hypothetical protein
MASKVEMEEDILDYSVEPLKGHSIWTLSGRVHFHACKDLQWVKGRGTLWGRIYWRRTW